MIKLIFLAILLFIVWQAYSLKKKADRFLGRKTKERGEELVQCKNCGVYIPKSEAESKLSLKGETLYFCSKQCKKTYLKKQ